MFCGSAFPSSKIYRLAHPPLEDVSADETHEMAVDFCIAASLRREAAGPVGGPKVGTVRLSRGDWRMPSAPAPLWLKEPKRLHRIEEYL